MIVVSCTLIDGGIAMAASSYDWTTYSVIWDGTAAGKFAGGDGSAANPYKISNGKELAYLLQTNNNGTSYSGKFFAITNDIYLNDISDYDNWSLSSHKPSNTWAGLNSFAGTIDGRNHTIYGMYMEGTENVGFINSTANLAARNAVNIKNLNFDKFRIKGNKYVGCIIGRAYTGTINNSTLNGVITRNTSSYLQYAGGCIGFFSSGGNRGLEIHNIKNYSPITGYSYIGGIVGYASVGNSSGYDSSGNGSEWILMDNCMNYAPINGTGNYVGGIGGEVSRSMNCGGMTISRFGNEGEIHGGSYTGGLFGEVYAGYTVLQLNESYNNGNVYGTKYVGGMIGYYSSSYSIYGWPKGLFDGFNTGNVTATTSYCGGISGYLGGVSIENCYNTGLVVGPEDTSIIAGRANYNNSCISSTYYLNNNTGLSVSIMCHYGTNKSFTEEEGHQKTTFNTFNFDTIWEIIGDYPTLRWQRKATAQVIASGKCGDEADWSLTNDNVLHISGSGDMYDYSSFSNTPWNNYRSQIYEIEIEDGISSVGSHSFELSLFLQKVTFGNSIISIKDWAFDFCSSLSQIELPETIAQIGNRAFTGSALKTITFTGNAPQFGSKPFENVTADAYYDANKNGWIDIIDSDLGGDLTWYDINTPGASTIKTTHISYHKEHWYTNSAMPMIPSDKISEYADELYEWAVQYGVDDVLTKDKAKEMVTQYMPTVLYTDGDIVATSKEYKVWEIMRDVLMLNSTKKSLDKWEHDYLVAPEVKDLTRSQKRLVEIMKAYTSYTESLETNPISEAFYNILSQKLGYDRNKTIYEMSKDKITNKLIAEAKDVLSEADLSKLKEKKDFLLECCAAWKEDGARSLEGYAWDVYEELQEFDLGKFGKNQAKKYGKKELNNLLDTISDEYPTIGTIREIKSCVNDYTGSFKSYAVVATFCPEVLFCIELSKLGKKVLDTVEDTKSAQYFMLQYYAFSHPEYYDIIIQEDGSIINYMDWTYKTTVEGVESTPFLDALLASWYKNGAQTVSADSRVKLANYAYNAATIQDMDMKNLQKSIVDFCVNELSEDKNSAGQITFTTNNTNGFKIKSGDTVVGTFKDGVFTQADSEPTRGAKSASEEEYYTVLENNKIIVTQNADNGSVSVTLKDEAYQIEFDNHTAPVAVSVINKDGSQQADIFDSSDSTVTYSISNGNVQATDENNNAVQITENYTKESSLAVQDADKIVIGYKAGDNAKRVTGKITLPTTGDFGSTISWYSSNPDVISADGTVNRQTENCTVTLTATVRNGNKYCERDYLLIVLGNESTIEIVLNGESKASITKTAGSKLLISELCDALNISTNNSCEWYFDEDKVYPVLDGFEVPYSFTVYAYANEYSVSAEQVTGGTVTPDKSTAISGETITLTVNPDTDYTETSIKYNNQDAVKQSDGIYTFEMPDENVTVTPVFHKSTKFMMDGIIDIGSVDVDDGFFTFVLSSSNNAPLPKSTDKSNVSNKVEFGNITYTELDAGQTYTYTISKNTNNSNNTWLSDDTLTVNVEITKTDSGDVIADPTYSVQSKTIASFVGYTIQAENRISVDTPDISDQRTFGDTTYYKAGSYVDLFISPDEGYSSTKATYNSTEADKEDEEWYSFIMPSENVVVAAEYKINQYTITFNTNGGSEIAPITQDYNTDITPPADPTKENAIFNGWNTNIPEKMPSYNMTISANWINMTKVEAKSASCSELGNIEYYRGSDGKNYLLNSQSQFVEYTGDTSIPKLEHTPAEMVIENNTPSTCTNTGYYDEVIYCSVCGEELSRERKTTDITAHTMTEEVIEPTCTEKGYTLHKCTECGYNYKDNYTDAKGHNYTAESVEASNGKPAHTIHKCSVCGEQISRNAFFESNGGTVLPSLDLFEKTTYGELPVPEKEGYTFKGWSLTITDKNSSEFAHDTAIYFRVPDDWRYSYNIYCHLWSSKTGESLHSWKSEESKCEAQGNGIYKYVIPAGSEVDGVIFASDGGYQTYDIAIGTACENDTLYCVQEIPQEYHSSTSKLYEASWSINKEFKSLISDWYNGNGLLNGTIDSPDVSLDGYKFVNSNTVIMSDMDHNLYAVWEINKYSISINTTHCKVILREKSSTNSGRIIASGEQVEYGTILFYEAIANDGYYFGTDQNNGNKAIVYKTGEIIVTDETSIAETAYAKHYHVGAFTSNNEAATASATASGTGTASYGETVTFTAYPANTGYEFIGWYYANNKLVSTDLVVKMKITSTTSLYARYRKTSGIVTFMSNGQQQGNEFTGETITAENFPTTPSALYGYQFTGWDKTVDEINAELRAGRNVTVNAIFEPIPNSFTVTIQNGKTNETVDCIKSTVITRVAEKVDGKTFVYWTKDGALFTYNSKISFTADDTCTITAVYIDDNAEAQVTAAINNVNFANGNLIIKAGMSVPDGMEIISVGIKTADNKQMTGAEDNSTNTTNNPAEFSVTKTNVSVNSTLYAQAYVTYTNGGTITTTESNVMAITAGQDYDASEKGTATIRFSSYNAETKKATFNAYLTVPENAVIVKAGLVAAPSTDFDPASDVLTDDNALFVKSLTSAEGKCAPVNYTWNKSNVNVGDTWYARAYLVYTLNGEQHIVYGSLISLTAEMGA